MVGNKWRYLAVILVSNILVPSLSWAAINVPIADPFFILSGTPTSVTATAYIPGATVNPNNVQLVQLNARGKKVVTLGKLNDAGINGDSVAGDRVFSITVNLQDGGSSVILLRVSAAQKGGRKLTADFEIPVVSVPTIHDASQYNETVDNIFLTVQETRNIFGLLNDPTTSPEDFLERLGQIPDNLLSVRLMLEAIYDFETNSPSNFPRILEFLPIFGSLIESARTADNEKNIFIRDGTDSRVVEIADWALTTCLDENELADRSPEGQRTRAECVQLYEDNNPNSGYHELRRESGRVIIKQAIQQFTTLGTDAIGGIFDLGFVVTTGIGKGIDKLIDIFVDKETNKSVLAVAEVQDGETLQLPTGDHDFIFSFGEDNERAISRGTLVNSGSTSTVTIAPGEIVESPSPVSPGFFVFSSKRSGNFDIYKINGDGTGLQNLTNNPADEYVQIHSPCSPDGSRIVFERLVPFAGLYTINSDGSGEATKVTDDGFFPNWSPDGQRIVYNGNCFGVTCTIYTIPAGGGEPIPLYTSGLAPQWSVSNRIAFLAIQGGVAANVGIINPDGTGLVIINLPSVSGASAEPRWSPDGSQLAFIREENEEGKIYTVDATGSNLKTTLKLPGRLNNASYNALSWSPDGKKFAFTKSGGIYVVNVDGSGLKNLTPETGLSYIGDIGPAWSPAGTELAYLQHDGQKILDDIFLIKADGTGTPVNITNSPNSQNLFPFWQPQ